MINRIELAIHIDEIVNVAEFLRSPEPRHPPNVFNCLVQRFLFLTSQMDICTSAPLP